MKQLSLTIPQNTTKAYELKFKNDSGVYQDITGWTVYFTVKASRDDSDANAVINIKQTTHDYPTQGETIITISEADSNITVGNYWYSIDYKDDDGNSGVIATGKLKIEDTVRDTRD